VLHGLGTAAAAEDVKPGDFAANFDLPRR